MDNSLNQTLKEAMNCENEHDCKNCTEFLNCSHGVDLTPYQACNECEFTENEGGEGFRYCDNPDSLYNGECVEDAGVHCKCFKQK